LTNFPARVSGALSSIVCSSSTNSLAPYPEGDSIRSKAFRIAGLLSNDDREDLMFFIELPVDLLWIISPVQHNMDDLHLGRSLVELIQKGKQLIPA